MSDLCERIERLWTILELSQSSGNVVEEIDAGKPDPDPNPRRYGSKTVGDFNQAVHPSESRTNNDSRDDQDIFHSSVGLQTILLVAQII